MIFLDRKSKQPLYEQIYRQLRDDILSGSLSPQSRLIATRTLAKDLGVGRNTVDAAYQQLLLEGYIVSKRGKGFLVEDLFRSKIDAPHSTEVSYKSGSSMATAESGPFRKSPDIKYNFQYGDISPDCFPNNAWRKNLTAVLDSYESGHITCYNDKQGDFSLRRQIRQYVKTTRGVDCTEDQIVITNGLLPALDLICRILPEKYRSIGMEEPGYDGARNAFLLNRIPVTPLSFFPDNFFFRDLENSLVRALYLTPSHQFPMGRVTPIKERYRILDWSLRTDSYIIEDDYDSDLRYHSSPIPSLYSVDTDHRVLYIGTFSKSLAPGLRCNYVILPPALLSEYLRVYEGFYPSGNWLMERALALYMENGNWVRHMRKVSKANQARHDTLVNELRATFRKRLRLYGENAGLHVLLQLSLPYTQEEIIELAADAGVAVYPTRSYFADPGKCPNNLFLMGFANMSEKEITEGVRLLGQTLLRH